MISDMNEMKILFGNKVKEKRLSMSLTQEQLAEKIGISSKSLSQIELGNNFVSAENLELICNALNVSPHVLFDFKQEASIDLLDIVIDKLKNNKKLLYKIYKIISIIE